MNEKVLNSKDYEQIEILRRMSHWLGYELGEVDKLMALAHVIEAKTAFGQAVQEAGFVPEDPGKLEDCERLIVLHLKSMRMGLSGTIKRLQFLMGTRPAVIPDKNGGGSAAVSSSGPARTPAPAAPPPPTPKLETVEVEEET